MSDDNNTSTFICINCSSAVLDSRHVHVYDLSSEFKIQRSRRKALKVPESARWKNLHLNISHVLDVIFQIADVDLSAGNLCTGCMNILNPLFQLYLQFITRSRDDSVMFKILQSTESIQRHLQEYLKRKETATEQNTDERECERERDPFGLEMESNNIRSTNFNADGFSQCKSILKVSLEKLQFVENIVEVKCKVEPPGEFFMLPELDIDYDEGNNGEVGGYPENFDDFEPNMEASESVLAPAKPKSRRGRKPKSRGSQSTKKARKKYYTKKHSSKVKVTKCTTAATPVLYKCNECHENFLTRGNLLVHTTVHCKDGAKHKCWICKCGFNTIKRQRDHMFKMHPDTQMPGQTATYSDFKCPVCSIKFLNESRLRRHLVGKHYNCPLCLLTCSTLEAINSHMETHGPHWLKPPYVYCQLCDYKSKLPNHIRRHQLVVHSLGEARFTCDVCGKKFLTKAQFTEHQACHSDERPFKCDQCEMTYKLSANLRDHKLATHAGIKYICEICGHASGSAANLRKHVDGVHHGIKQSQKRSRDGEKKKRFRLSSKNSRVNDDFLPAAVKQLS